MRMSQALGIGIVGACVVAILVGLAFGVALGAWYTEPKFKNARLHEGDWQLQGIVGRTVMWQRKGDRRLDCDAGHRAYVCTIIDTTEHVDACDCGATRTGVYGHWS